MGEPLDELYFKWLYRQVADPEIESQELTFWKILRVLYTTEFVSLVSFDENRISDAKDLRKEFVDSEGLEGVDPEWIELGCSLLELMVGLSRRLAFEGDGRPHYWFWMHLMVNLGLDRFNDSRRFRKTSVDYILDDLIQRRYGSDGHGGFFPLQNPQKDQRRVELWYQLNAYLNEREERRARGEDVP